MNKSAWEKLAQGTIGSISDLNDAGKLNSKSSFVNLTKIIIKSIQMLFKGSFFFLIFYLFINSLPYSYFIFLF